MANTIEYSGATPISKDTYILGLNTQPPYSAKSKPAEIAHLIGDGVFAEKGDTYTKQEVADGFASKEDTYTKAEVDEKIAEGGGGGEHIPIGTIIPFTGDTEPLGFFYCEGQYEDPTVYPKLFEVVGYNYGRSGDLFRLPDLRGRFLEGSDSAGTYKEAGLPDITGSTDVTYAVVRGNQTGAFKDSTFSGGTKSSCPPYSTSDTYGKLDFKASNSNEIYGNSETVQPSSLTVRYIIKAYDSATTETEIVEIEAQIASHAIRLSSVEGRRHIVRNTLTKDGEEIVGVIEYSDGWLEQYGYGEYVSTSGTVNNLHEPFKTANYSVMLTTTSGASYSTYAYGVSARTTTNFKVYANSSASRSYCWIARGWGENS